MPKMHAILNIFVETRAIDKVINALEKLPEVVDLYEVTGEYDLVAIIETDTISSFRNFLKDEVLRVEGVRSTVTSVVLFTHKKEGELMEV